MRKIQQKKTVALADDDIIDIEIFEDALGIVLEYFDFRYFKNGIELIKFLENPEETMPDILFLDLNMPLMGGFETLRKIREDLQLGTLTVAMYTTSSDAEDISRSFATGANLFVTKPNDFKKLTDTLYRIFYSTVDNGGLSDYMISI